MTHDDGSTIEGLDSFLQHILRRHVEMVGGLIKNQQVYWFQQQTDHRQTTSLSSTQDFHLLI